MDFPKENLPLEAVDSEKAEVDSGLESVAVSSTPICQHYDRRRSQKLQELQKTLAYWTNEVPKRRKEGGDVEAAIVQLNNVNDSLEAFNGHFYFVEVGICLLESHITTIRPLVDFLRTWKQTHPDQLLTSATFPSNLQVKLSFLVPTDIDVYCYKLTVDNGICCIATMEYLSAHYHGTKPVFGANSRWNGITTKRKNAPEALQYIERHFPSFSRAVDEQYHHMKFFCHPQRVVTWLETKDLSLSKSFWGEMELFSFWELEVPRAIWHHKELEDEYICLRIASTPIKDGYEVREGLWWPINRLIDIIRDDNISHACLKLSHFYPLPTGLVTRPNVDMLEELLEELLSVNER